jgi:hypothetical protein
MGNCAEKRHPYQQMSGQKKRCEHCCNLRPFNAAHRHQAHFGADRVDAGVPTNGAVLSWCYLNAATVAYGSADWGRKRLIVNCVG